MSERRIATVLMLDVVGSTHVTSELGDARYHELSTRFQRIVREHVRRFGGRIEDNAGDGFFLTFPQPDRAIRAAAAISDGVRALGIEIRCGIHTGQTESREGKTQGIAVVIGARVMSLAGPGEILATATTKELVTGAGFGFEDLSAHELKGVPGRWQVFAVTAVDGEPRPRPLPAAEAAERRAAIRPATGRGRRGRALVWAVGGTALAIVVGVVAVATTGGRPEPSRPSGTDGPRPESIVQVDPAEGRILAVVPAPVAQRGRPGLRPETPDHAMAVGLGGVWTLRSYRWLYHVDPRSRELRDTIVLHAGATFSKNLAVGLDEVWMAHDGGLVEVDPATGDQRSLVTFGSSDQPGAADLALGGGSVWVVTSQGSLIRFDPISGVSEEADIGGTPDSIGFGHGSVWVGDAFAGTVTRYDARTLRPGGSIRLSQGVDHLVVGSDVWALSRTLGALVRIDVARDTVAESVSVGDEPTGVATGDGAIWVGDEDGVIRRVDEGTRQVTEIPFGAPIRALAYDEATDTLWIDVAGPE